MIHVRRHDYLRSAHAHDGWTPPSLGYFQRAKAYFTECLERVQFIVLSDGLLWCHKYLSGPNVAFAEIRGHSAANDLAIASLCDHAIITIGSFSWWAGWLTNGVVITNKDVPRPGSTLTRRLHREDYYKPEWVAL